MSAKKGFETKLREDENTDSGFLSGEITEPCDSGELDSGVIDCDDKKLINVDDDSDVTAITGQLVDVTVCDTTNPTPRQSDIPPLAILFQQDEDGDTQLHIASVHGCVKSVSTLIRVCPRKDWLNVPNDYGHTPLHLAVMSGNAVVAKMLMIAGASLAVRDYTGETPLHKATSALHMECLKALLAHQPRISSSVLDQRNYNGQSCVHIAASAGSIEALQTLVYYGADINAREHLAGWTALHIAARRGDAKLVQYLRERCPGVAAHERDHAGRTARRLARYTKAEKAFPTSKDDSETESDSDDDGYDSESETLFEKLRDSLSGASINVA